MIDKLYFIRREYRAKKLSRAQKTQRICRIWNDIYGKPDNKSKGTSKIYRKLVEARNLYRKQVEADEEDEVVAQSSGFTSNTLGSLLDEDLVAQMYESAGLTNQEDLVKAIYGDKDEDLDADDDGLTEEEKDEQEDSIEESERLFRYWELAGLDKPEKEGGTGMSATEYFENFVAKNYSKYTVFQTYDQKKPLAEQHQAVINNLLFSLYQARLEDYDTFQERYTPSGFDNLKRAKPIMLTIKYAPKEKLAKCNTFADLVALSKSEDFSPKYDATEPSTLVHYQTQNALYDKLIGIAANQNINQKFTSLMGIFRLKIPIKWGSMLKSNDAGMGKDIKQRFMHTVNPQTMESMILDTESSSKENLAASVDAVKDALLEYFGITINNFNIASFMGKIGATPEDLGLILNQPIVQKAMEIIDSNGRFTDLTEALYKALESLVGKDIANNEIKNTLVNIKPTEKEAKASSITRDKYVNLDALTKGIAIYAGNPNATVTDDEFIKIQVAVISLLQELQVAATIISDEIKITRGTSVSSVQSDFGSVEVMEQRAIAFSTQTATSDFPFEMQVTSTSSDLNQTVIDPYARIEAGNEEAFIDTYMQSAFGIAQTAYSAIMTFIDNVLSIYFPYRSQGFRQFKNILATFTNKSKLNADIINAANKFFPMYCMEKMVPIFMENHRPEIIIPNGKGEYRTERVNIPNKHFYKEFFPAFLIKVIEENQKAVINKATVIDYSKIPILAYITPRRQNLTKGYISSNLILKAETIGSLQKEQKDLYIESWEQMFKSNDPILQNLAVHLFMYSYYVGGFDFGNTTFMSLAPLALKISLGITDENPNSGYAQFFNRLFNLCISENLSYLKEQGNIGATAISIKKAIKSFLANNCTKFTQFSKIVYSKKDDLYKAIQKRLEDSDSKFTVDFTEEGEDTIALRGLITEPIELLINGKKVKKYKVKPCVVIGGDSPSVYICDVNWNDDSEVNFNICDGKITYYKITPLMGKDNSDVQLFIKEEFEKEKEVNYTTVGLATLEQYHQMWQQELQRQLSEMESKKQKDLEDNGSTGVTIETTDNIFDVIKAKAQLAIRSTINLLFLKKIRDKEYIDGELVSIKLTSELIEKNEKIDVYNKILSQIISTIHEKIAKALKIEDVDELVNILNKLLFEHDNYKNKFTSELLSAAKNEVLAILKELKDTILKYTPDINGSDDLNPLSSDYLEKFKEMLNQYRNTTMWILNSGIEKALEISTILRTYMTSLQEALEEIFNNDKESNENIFVIKEIKDILNSLKTNKQLEANDRVLKYIRLLEANLDKILSYHNNRTNNMGTISYLADKAENSNEAIELNVC